MRKLLFSIILVLLSHNVAHAITTYTTHYNLAKPGDGDTGWGSAVRGNFDTIDTQLWSMQPKDTDLTDIAGLSCLANNILGKDGSNVWACLTTLNLSSSSLILPSSINLPATCTVGQIYMDTDATTGRRLYACENTNNWVQQGAGGSGSGDVLGPATNTDSYIPQWNGTNNKTLKNGVMLDTDASLVGNSDARIASQKATKGYIDGKQYTINGWVDPVTAYNASGLPVTTGTITTGTNTMTVADASSWTTGQQITFNLAGPGQGRVRGCYKVSVSGSVLTMLNSDNTACNVAWQDYGLNATVVNVVVHHHPRVTTGSVSANSNSLTVASAATWVNGQGILVRGAGSAGADLVCPKITIAGTTITMYQSNGSTACNASTTVSSANVLHDDTYAFQQAIASYKNIHIPRGSYSITSEMVFGSNQWLEGEGRFATMIFHPITSGNVFRFQGSYNVIRNLSISGHLDPWLVNPIPTSGYGIQFADGTASAMATSLYNSVRDVNIWGTYRGIGVLDGATGGWIENCYLEGYAEGGYVKDDIPNGDIMWKNNYLLSNTTYGLRIVAADTNNFDSNKFGGILLQSNNTSIQSVRFVNPSTEAISFCGWADQNCLGMFVVDATTLGGTIKGVVITGGEMYSAAGQGNSYCVSDSGGTGTSFTGVTMDCGMGNIDPNHPPTIIRGCVDGDGFPIPDRGESATPLGNGSTATLVGPRQYYVCSGTCSVTLPALPASNSGYEFCVVAGNSVASMITVTPQSTNYIEATSRSAYCTMGHAIKSGGSVGDRICFLGIDQSHYLSVSYNGAWACQ